MYFLKVFVTIFLGVTLVAYLFNIKEKDELAKKLMEKVSGFQKYAMTSGIATAWNKNKDYYENRFFSKESNDIDIANIGEQGEILATGVGHFRNIVRHILNPIVSLPISYTVSAVNDSVESRRSTEIYRQVLEYYEKVKRYGKILNQTTEYAVVYGSGFYIKEWNPEMGKEVIGEDGRFRKEGDFDDEALSPFDVFYDFTRKGEQDWYIFRRKKNKYDVAASFTGEKKEKIEKLESFFRTDDYYKGIDTDFETDDIWVYSAYHKSTPACEGGRYVLFCGDKDGGIHLYDSKNIYGEKLPIFPMMPGKRLESGFGFTDVNLLRAPQMVYNDAMTSLYTNMQNGLNDVWCPSGDEVDIEVLSSGRNLWQSTTKPEVVQLMGDVSGLIAAMNFMNQQMETISAQNAVVRGNAGAAPNLKSGIAVQTVVSMGQQFSFGLQAERNSVFEDITMFMLDTLRNFADTDRLIDIVGVTGRNEVLEFTKQDLTGVSRVLVEQVNPILNTPAGRIEIAQEYMKLNPKDFTYNDFMEVANTGNLRSAVKSSMALNDYIAQVKQRLLEGEALQPIAGTNHVEVIKEVQGLLLNLTFSTDDENAEAVQNITNFISQSMEMMRKGDEIANLIYGGQAPTPMVPSAMQPNQPMPQNQGQPNQGQRR